MLIVNFQLSKSHFGRSARFCINIYDLKSFCLEIWCLLIIKQTSLFYSLLRIMRENLFLIEEISTICSVRTLKCVLAKISSAWSYSHYWSIFWFAMYHKWNNGQLFKVNNIYFAHLTFLAEILHLSKDVFYYR